MKYRKASKSDLPTIINLFIDDELGVSREVSGEPIASTYLKAFEEISEDPKNQLYVMEDNEGVIGVMQLIIIPHLNRNGTKRAQIESVHIERDYRGKGYGRKFMEFAIEKAKEHGCGIVQLTTDKTRDKAHKFYLDLGFADTHIGMKIHI